MHVPVPKLSPAEEAFERIRKRLGLFLAPFAGLVLAVLPIPGLEPNAHKLFAILGVVILLWITEAIPMAATAFLGPTLCVVAGIAPAREVYRSFADPIIFLFVGSFMIVEAMRKHGLDRRVAFAILGLRAVGESPFRLYAAFGGITTLISMWVSNAATTAMMLPIGLAILGEMSRRQFPGTDPNEAIARMPFATGLMLLTAFAASVGGLATPIGTPPNLIGIGMLERTLGVRISFFEWMKIGLPVSLVLGTFLIFNFHRTCPASREALTGSGSWLAAERKRLGSWSRGEINVLVVFLLAIVAWILPGISALWTGNDSSSTRWLNARLSESTVALLAASALFVLPTRWKESRFTLSWPEAVRIDWGTIFLFAGGMALGEQMFGTGLARWIGDGLAGLFNATSVPGLVMLFTGVAILVSEATSNTASATMVVPVAIAVAQSAGVDPMKPALAACLGSSMGFLLPVSTGPNAMVYGSGCVPLLRMIRHGALLDVVGYGVIVLAILPLA